MLFVVVGLLLLGFVFAIPSIPNAFSGNATYSEDPLWDLTDSEISASIDGYGLGVVGNVDSGNSYSVMIDPQGRTGEITFYIGGIEAHPTAIYEAGDFSELDLIIDEEPLYAVCGNSIQEPGEQCDGSMLGVGTCENVLGILGATGTLSCTGFCTFDYSNCTAPFCGDGACNSGEDCSSCAADCGACSSGGSSGSGGGSSGGGSSGGSSSGGAYSLVSNGTYVAESVNVSSDDDTIVSSSDVEPENVEANRFLSMITGAVIGGGAGSWLFALVLLGLILFIFFIARKEMAAKEAAAKKKKALARKKALMRKKPARKKVKKKGK